jgi:hypothetical protein
VAKEPAVLVFIVEIVVDDGRLKPGVNLDTISEAIDTAVWGVIVPTQEINATRKRCLPTKGHIHDGDEPCKHDVNYGYNGRNSASV